MLSGGAWLGTMTRNNYIFMEYIPRDPNKPVTSVMFYTDTFDLEVFFCARYKVAAKDFNKIKGAIDKFPFIEKADTSIFSYYNITISEGNKRSRYFTENGTATAKLFTVIVDTISNVKIKRRLKDTFKSIEYRLE